MSVVVAKVKALNRQLDQISCLEPIESDAAIDSTSSLYLSYLNASLSILSAPAYTTLPLHEIARLIVEVNQAKLQEPEQVTQSNYAKELEWLFLARCTVDVYACLLEQLFQQTLPLAQDIFYWDSVLSQPSWRLLFLLQSLDLSNLG